jgi:hypothetical protein
MTIDLKDHMEKKKQEKHVKAYDKIGAAVDGLSIGTVLHILSAFTAAVLNNMEEPDRSKAAMVFSSVIMESKEEPVQ